MAGARESFPEIPALPGRMNIVITRGDAFAAEGAVRGEIYPTRCVSPVWRSPSQRLLSDL